MLYTSFLQVFFLNGCASQPEFPESSDIYHQHKNVQSDHTSKNIALQTIKSEISKEN